MLRDPPEGGAEILATNQQNGPFDWLITAHPEVGTLCAAPAVIAGWSGRRVEDGAVQGRPGDSKAGGYFGNRDVGGFEQRPDGLDLFGGEFGWPALKAFETPDASMASDCLPNGLD